MYYAASLDEVTPDLLESRTYQNFWCEHTKTDTGPDDRFVEHSRCSPDRVCYEPRGGGL